VKRAKRIPEMEDPAQIADTSFINSEIIEVTSTDMIEVDMQYVKLGQKNAEPRCFMRKEAYEHLLIASENIPKGHKIKILDAWRPFSLQRELYDAYSGAIIEKFKLENCSDEEKRAVIRKFISEPVDDRDNPPVHTTGGAIDLTLVGPDGNELEMGSGFDEFSEKTHTAYYENVENPQIRDNRRALYNAMLSAGFSNLPSEWWHYDYGDRFWAFYMRKPALYRGLFTREELNAEGQ